MLARQGVTLGCQTLYNGIGRAATKGAPLVNLMQQRALQQETADPPSGGCVANSMTRRLRPVNRRRAENRHQLAVRHLAVPGATVARFLGVTTSAVNRAAWSAPLPELEAFT